MTEGGLTTSARGERDSITVHFLHCQRVEGPRATFDLNLQVPIVINLHHSTHLT